MLQKKKTNKTGGFNSTAWETAANDCLVWQGLSTDNIKVWEQNQIAAAEQSAPEGMGVLNQGNNICCTCGCWPNFLLKRSVKTECFESTDGVVRTPNEYFR